MRIYAQAKHALIREAASYELSALQPFALCALEPGHATKMNTLLDYLTCDPSHLTGIVDLLEFRGYISRRDCETDRRIKMISLTKRGVETRDALLRAYFSSFTKAIREIPTSDRDSLHSLFT